LEEQAEVSIKQTGKSVIIIILQGWVVTGTLNLSPIATPESTSEASQIRLPSSAAKETSVHRAAKEHVGPLIRKMEHQAGLRCRKQTANR
jgi:hypothetical protein